MLIEAQFSTNLTCTAIFSENPCFPIGYRQPLIFQYIYHIKLATLGAYITLHTLLSVKSIILFVISSRIYSLLDLLNPTMGTDLCMNICH